MNDSKFHKEFISYYRMRKIEEWLPEMLKGRVCEVCKGPLTGIEIEFKELTGFNFRWQCDKCCNRVWFRDVSHQDNLECLERYNDSKKLPLKKPTFQDVVATLEEFIEVRLTDVLEEERKKN